MEIPIKESDMRQVGQELAKLQKAVIERLNQIKFHHLIAVLYVAISMAIRITPNQAAMGWLKTTYGIQGDFLSILFAACGVLIAYNPPKRYFVAAVLPLFVYLIIFTLYSIETTFFSITGFWYIAALISFILILQFKTFGKLRLHHVYSFYMMMIGTGIFDTPERGVANWIESRYGIPGEALGFVLIVGALWLAFNPRPQAFSWATAMFVVYVGSSVVFSATNATGGLVGVAVASSLLTCILWTYRHLNKYFEVA